MPESEAITPVPAPQDPTNETNFSVDEIIAAPSMEARNLSATHNRSKDIQNILTLPTATDTHSGNPHEGGSTTARSMSGEAPVMVHDKTDLSKKI